MSIPDTYRKFIRAMLKGHAYHLLGSGAFDPLGVGIELERTKHQAGKTAIERCIQLVCPDCTGRSDDHPRCEAEPLRQLLAQEEQKMALFEEIILDAKDSPVDPTPTQTQE
jgi:hypothetical protein